MTTLLADASLLFGQSHWVPETFGMAVLATLAFGAIGIALAIVGFKLFDLLTPGKLEDEIFQKQNMAAAILGGSIIIGICLVVAAAVG